MTINENPGRRFVYKIDDARKKNELATWAGEYTFTTKIAFFSIYEYKKASTIERGILEFWNKIKNSYSYISIRSKRGRNNPQCTFVMKIRFKPIVKDILEKRLTGTRAVVGTKFGYQVPNYSYTENIKLFNYTKGYDYVQAGLAQTYGPTEVFSNINTKDPFNIDPSKQSTATPSGPNTDHVLYVPRFSYTKREMAHEYGHFLGLIDRYHGTAEHPHKYYDNDLMGGWPKGTVTNLTINNFFRKYAKLYNLPKKVHGVTLDYRTVMFVDKFTIDGSTSETQTGNTNKWQTTLEAIEIKPK